MTLLEELQRRHPGEYDEGVLRTLQRRMRQWRATHGAEREVYFAQEHPPGRLGLSDFTVADDLGVIVDGERFDHRLYQFALGHSGWRHAMAVQGGERFISLSEGLQDVLWHFGGVPESTAPKKSMQRQPAGAFKNLAEEDDLDAPLCRVSHDKMRASRCDRSQSHENVWPSG